MSLSRPRPSLLLALALTAAPASADTQLGTEFWFAWPETPDLRATNPGYDVDARLILLAGDGPARVSVQGPGVNELVDVAPGAPALVRLPRESAMITASEVPVAQAVHVEVQGCGTIAALLRVPGSAASFGDDVARLFPVPTLGTRYLPTAYEGLAEFVVVATEDDTTVTIRDPNRALPDSFRLDRGEALLRRGSEDGSLRDVTGMVVEASAPVAVLSGSARSEVVSHQLTGQVRLQWQFDDVLLESNWPTDLFGRTHVHAPFPSGSADASGDLVRLVAGCDGSAASVDEAGTVGRNVALAGAGDDVQLLQVDAFAQRIRLLKQGTLIRSSRPIQATALSVGNIDAGLGDPSLTVLDPVERWEREALAWLPEGYVHSLAIVAPVGATDSVRVDGAAPASTWQPVADGSEWSWLRLDGVAPGEHRIAADAPISVQVSGHLPEGREGAYSYPAIAMRPDRAAGVRIASATDPCGRPCPGSCVELRAPTGLSDVEWSTGDWGGGASACEPGLSLVSLRGVDASGCPHAAELLVAVTEADPNASIDGPVSTCPGGCVELVGPAGYESYEWSTGETSPSILACVNEPSRIGLRLAASNGCTLELEHEIDIEAPPQLGAPTAELLPTCTPGILLSWSEAQWRTGSPGGSYHVWRRGEACEAAEGGDWELVASDLDRTSWVDRDLRPGERVSYRVEAKAAATGEDCGAGLSGFACAAPGSLLVPTEPPSPLSLSPWLRARSQRGTADERRARVSWHWEGAGELGAGGGIEVLSSTRAQELLPVDWIEPLPEWTDEQADRGPLVFYRVVRVGPCGDRGD